MSDYGTGFLMAGVSLIVSGLFLLLLHITNRRGQGTANKSQSTHKDNKGQSLGGEEKEEQDMTWYSAVGEFKMVTEPKIAIKKGKRRKQGLAS